jgi:hypothetical protein
MKQKYARRAAPAGRALDGKAMVQRAFAALQGYENQASEKTWARKRHGRGAQGVQHQESVLQKQPVAVGTEERKCPLATIAEATEMCF